MEPTPAPQSAQFFIVAAAAAIGAGVAVVVATWGLRLYESEQYAYDPYGSTGSEAYEGDASCNVLGVQVHGTIVASRADIPLMDTQTVQNYDGTSSLVAPNYTVANEIEDTLRNASADPSIKAILVDVNSYGGGVVAGQEVANAIRKFGKYSVSIIHEAGASSGYLSAAAADKVLAGQDSAVGSIGVTSSYVDQVEKDRKEGYTYQQLSSGVFKDTGSPSKPLTAAERALIMRDVNLSRDHFVKLVAEYRGLSFDAVNKLADGSTMLGLAAVETGLIDAIGTTWDALDAIEAKIGEPVSLCWQ